MTANINLKTNRIDYIDIAKGIAIILMVMAHTSRTSDIQVFIFAFNMPIFFFISGLFFNTEKYISFIAFIQNKFKTLILPYLTFYIISYLYWSIIERYIRPNSIGKDLLTPLIGLLYGTDYKDYMIPNVALWFLTGLFTAETILYLVLKNVKKNVFKILLISGICFFGFCISLFNFPKLPLSFNSSLFAILFIYIGYSLKNKIHLIENINKLLLTFLGILLIIITYFVSFENGKVDMNYCNYQNPIYFLMAAFLGIIGILIICIVIKKSFILQYFGVNSLILLGLSEPIKRAIIGTFSKLTSIPVEQIRSSIYYSIIIVIVTLVVFIPIIHIFNTYLYKLIGKKFTSTRDY